MQRCPPSWDQREVPRGLAQRHSARQGPSRRRGWPDTGKDRGSPDHEAGSSTAMQPTWGQVAHVLV